MWDYILDHWWVRIIIYMIIGNVTSTLVTVHPELMPHLVILSGVALIGILCVVYHVQRKWRKEDDLNHGV